MGSLRHQGSRDNLENPSDPAHKGSEESSDTRAEGQETKEEGQHREKQADEDERKHESSHQKVVIGSSLRLASICCAINKRYLPDKLVGDICLRMEIAMARGIKRVCGMRRSASAVTVIVHTADVPECPSRHSRCAGNIPCVHLKEPDPVQRRCVVRTTEQCEKDQQDGTCHEEHS